MAAARAFGCLAESLNRIEVCKPEHRWNVISPRMPALVWWSDYLRLIGWRSVPNRLAEPNEG
jgi:hypothetical protein